MNIFDFIYLAKFANNTFEGKEYYMRNKMHISLKILLGLLVGIIIFLLMFILYVKFGISKEIDLSLLKTGQTTVTKIYAFDRENGEIRLDLPIELSEERIFLQNSEWCSIAGIPENLKNAFIAVEDHKFYEHKGVNWQRTIRAGLNYIANFGKSEFGGSTIT
ncbi:MAG: transglycosylase domain-containing protein, partial [Clostridia bacterium]|nr:transglycosylase domain-containing protein [Clostridia bacterium]